MAKHTLGPWELNERERTVYIPKGPHSSIVAYGGTLANARLIAAAPELADAVRDLLLLIDDAELLKTYKGPLYPVVGSAKAAIAKAEDSKEPIDG